MAMFNNQRVIDPLKQWISSNTCSHQTKPINTVHQTLRIVSWWFTPFAVSGSNHPSYNWTTRSFPTFFWVNHQVLGNPINIA
jgi:hypothetical protein